MKRKKPRKRRKARLLHPLPRKAAPPLCEVCQKPLPVSHSIMPPCVHPECAYKGFFDAVQQAFWKYFPWVLLSAAVPIGATAFIQAEKGIAKRKTRRKNKS